MTPKLGDPAPDFELEGTAGRFRLSDDGGGRVVLLFYPGDNTPVCTRQFCSYRDDAGALAQLDATIVGISDQSLESHQSFTTKHGLTVPLLADPGSEVAKRYGAWMGVRGTKRAVMIVDEQGRVAHRHEHTLGLDFHNAAELSEALASLPRAG
jgi:thioredoxin-dependent peroxiredoxin